MGNIMELPAYILAAIKEHVQTDPDHEVCGLVVAVDGEYRQRLRYIPCVNNWQDPTGETTTADHFAISPDDWIAAEEQGEIVRVIHSHPGQGNEPLPSLHDKMACNASGVVWGIMSEIGEYIEITPEKPPLIGRRFVLGVTDCYGLIMDWHAKQGVIVRDEREPYQWWTTGENFYMERWQRSGYVECEPYTPGAMVIMQIASDVPNHAGIYLPGNRLLHHMFGEVSTTVPYAGYYEENTVLWVRHKDLPQEITEWL